MSRARRADVETAELARRRLEAVLGPRRALRSARPAADHSRARDVGWHVGGDVDADLGWDADGDLGWELDADLGLDADRDGDGDVQLDRDPAADFGQRRPATKGGAELGRGTRLTDRARDFTRGHLGVVLALAVIGLLVAAGGVARARPLAASDPEPPSVTLSAAPTSPGTTASTPATTSGGATTPAGSTGGSGSPTGAGSAATAASEIVVHVVGEVRRPGVVRLAAGARVADAIDAAGGLAAGAVPGELNLAQPLLDGQQVVLVGRAAGQRDPPERSEVRDPGSGGGGAAQPGPSSGAGSIAPGAKVNLNTATAAQLDTLSGVGPVTAQRILDWRSAHGRFSRVEELQEVDGIGPKTFAQLAPQVTV